METAPAMCLVACVRVEGPFRVLTLGRLQLVRSFRNEIIRPGLKGEAKIFRGIRESWQGISFDREGCHCHRNQGGKCAIGLCGRTFFSFCSTMFSCTGDECSGVANLGELATYSVQTTGKVNIGGWVAGRSRDNNTNQSLAESRDNFPELG